MSELNRNEMIDLGSESAAEEFDPFADENDAGDETTENIPSPEQSADTAAKPTDKTAENFADKPPVFEYAGATENIDDVSKTFDELRIEKAVDFPELEDGKKVSWTVEYGKITKNVSDPKGMSVGKMKSDIETSKEFEDSLKKRGADKNPVCKIKPRVTAQSKGDSSAYKGVYPDMESAVASGKLITLFPARDGRVYEMRQNELGRFVTPSAGSGMLSAAQAGFTPALPPVPFKHLLDVISLFRKIESVGGNEALVNIYWDKHEEVYFVDVPEQTASPISVDSRTNPKYENDRYIHYMDIHSHCRMRAFFSSVDDRDEKATRVYAVVGRVNNYFPELKVRISNGGTYLEIEPDVVFERYNCVKRLAVIWFDRFQQRVGIINELISSILNNRRNKGEIT